MNLINLVKTEYWFSQPFSAHGSTFWIFVILFLALILTGIVMRLMVSSRQEKTTKIIFRRFSSFCMTMGLWGIAWLFFRQERVVFLAWRFWLMLWLIVTVWWLARILEYIVKRVPKIKEDQKMRRQKDKYMPS